MDETMNLSDTNLPSEGPDSNMNSPLKLSYERSSSPDMNSCSSSSSELHSLSSPHRVSSPANEETHRSNSPTVYMHSSSPPQSPMSTSSYSSSVEQSPNHSYFYSPRRSPQNSPSPYNSPLLRRSRSPSPTQGSPLYSPPPSPQRSLSALSSSSSHSQRERSLSPIDYRISPPQSPLMMDATSSVPVTSSPSSPPIEPSSPVVRSPSPYQPQYLVTGRSFSTSYMQQQQQEHTPSHSRSQDSENVSEPSPFLPAAGSTSPPPLRPFYSLSPKSERDTKSPLLLALASPSLSSVTSTTTTTVSTSATTVDVQISGEASVEDDQDAIPLSSSSQPPEVVVDVDQGKPCVVDLTEEDDDDVEIVSTEEPVVFLSESNTRRRRKRARHHSQLRSTTSITAAAAAAAAASSTTAGSEDPIILSDTPLTDHAGDSPATAIDVTDTPAIITLHSAASPRTSSSSTDPPLPPPQLFGDFLDQSVVPIEPEITSARPTCTCIQTVEGSSGATLGFCVLHGLASSLRLPERVSQSDRSRSPLDLDEGDASLHGGRGGGGAAPPLSLLEAPIPEDVLEDIVSLYAENNAAPPPSLLRRFFLGEDYRERRAQMRRGERERARGLPLRGPHLSSSLRDAAFALSLSRERGGDASLPYLPPAEPFHLPQSLSIPGTASTAAATASASTAAAAAVPHPTPSSSSSSSSNSSTASNSSTSSNSSTCSSSSLSSTSTASTHGGPSTDRGTDRGTEDSTGLSCPICFESFHEIKKDGKSLSSTVCGHIFCTLCLQASFKQAKQCPTCRKRINKKQYHPVYI